jgi:hypothetical protein
MIIGQAEVDLRGPSTSDQRHCPGRICRNLHGAGKVVRGAHGKDAERQASLEKTGRGRSSIGGSWGIVRAAASHSRHLTGLVRRAPQPTARETRGRLAAGAMAPVELTDFSRTARRFAAAPGHRQCLARARRDEADHEAPVQLLDGSGAPHACEVGGACDGDLGVRAQPARRQAAVGRLAALVELLSVDRRRHMRRRPLQQFRAEARFEPPDRLR